MMNTRERLLSIIDGEEVDMAPALSFTSPAVIELMEASGAWRPEADLDPGKMATLGLAGYRHAGLEAARVPFGVSILDEIMGCEVDPGDHARTRAVKGPAIAVGDPYPEIPDDLTSRGRIPAVLEAIRLIREEVGEDLPIIAGVEGPADLAANMVDVQEFLMALIMDRDWMDGLLGIASRASLDFGRACLAAGADLVSIGETVSSCNLISPQDFGELMVPRYRWLADGMGGHTFLYVCGEVQPVWEDIIGCGFDGLGLENERGEADLKRLVGRAHEDHLPVAGSLSTSQTLYTGGVEDVRKESIRNLEAGMDILSPGGGLAPETTIENLRAMVRARDEFFGAPHS